MANGYASFAYASAFSSWGRLRSLLRSGGYLIERVLPAGHYTDMTCCYPVFGCRDWKQLGGDLDDLPEELVTVTLVSDALATINESDLLEFFPWVRPLSEHFVIDLEVPLENRISKHHRRKLRQVERDGLQIKIVDDTTGFLPEWMRLYTHLVEKRSINGPRRFSVQALAAQLRVPGTVLVCAERKGQILGADWYYVDNGRVYAHLSAYSEAGYASAVSYPLMHYALEYFRDSCGIIDLGGVPNDRGSDSGLGYFKSGWSTHRLPSFVCGKVLNTDIYKRLTAKRKTVDYFPPYRFREYR